MATLRQIEANRLNSQKSTGPRTLQGKAVSRFNALKSGIDAISEIIGGEDYNELEALAADYYLRWQPALPEERFLVDALVHDEWQLRRLRKAEAYLWTHFRGVSCGWDGTKTFAPMGVTFERGAGDFMRLQRRIGATERSYHLTLDKLQSLAAQVPDAADQPEPTVSIEVTPDPPPQIGFVPPIPVGQASRPAVFPSQPQTGPVQPAEPVRDFSLDRETPAARQAGILRAGQQPPHAA
jgi:hypothetical protein